VVEHDALADLGRRIDVDGKDARALALQVQREIAPPVLEQLVREAIGHQGMKALEVEQRLDIAAAGRIAVVDGGEIGAERRAQLRMVGQYLIEGLADQPGIDVRVVEALRQAMTDRVFQPWLAQDGCVDEPTERRLAARNLLGLFPHRRPDRVNGGDAGTLCHSRFRSHVSLLRP
jgi:hypothetical protein